MVSINDWDIIITEEGQLAQYYFNRLKNTDILFPLIGLSGRIIYIQPEYDFLPWTKEERIEFRWDFKNFIKVQR